MGESARDRWRRRIRTIPAMVGMTAVATAAVPLALPALAVTDLVRGRWRLPAIRVYLFILQYLINDTVEVVLAPLFWAQAGFGRRLSSTASQERHRRVQQWSIRLLARRADQLLGLRLRVDENGLDAMLGPVGPGSRPGPVIVISRHVSLFDASLPDLVLARHHRRIRGVVMAELLADPGFDLFYGRLGSVFIRRDDGASARAAVAAMTDDADPSTAYVLFPEGRLFRPGRLRRSLERLGETDSTRAARLGSLTRVLPPRPGGFQLLLGALPTADVLLVDHRGLDDLGRIAALAHRAPLNRTVEVTVRRFLRSGIPTEPDGQARWLDDRWLELDAALATQPSIPSSGSRHANG